MLVERFIAGIPPAGAIPAPFRPRSLAVTAIHRAEAVSVPAVGAEWLALTAAVCSVQAVLPWAVAAEFLPLASALGYAAGIAGAWCLEPASVARTASQLLPQLWPGVVIVGLLAGVVAGGEYAAALRSGVTIAPQMMLLSLAIQAVSWMWIWFVTGSCVTLAAMLFLDRPLPVRSLFALVGRSQGMMLPPILAALLYQLVVLDPVANGLDPRVLVPGQMALKLGEALAACFVAKGLLATRDERDRLPLLRAFAVAMTPLAALQFVRAVTVLW